VESCITKSKGTAVNKKLEEKEQLFEQKT